VSDSLTTAEVIAKFLATAGTSHIFGYPGDPNIELIEAARKEGIEMILARREGTAGFMAEAYGMLAGRPGVCLSTLGPGSTSLVNAVASAFLDRVPMLAISGQVSTSLEPFFTHQVIDHNRLYAPITKWAVRVVPEAVATIMRKSFRVAVAERPGPVHITTNGNVLTQPASDSEVRVPPVAPMTEAAYTFANEATSSPIIERIRKARRPVILTGISAARARASAALVAFVEKAGCPVVVSPMAKGVFPEDHAYYASTLDMACNKIVWDFLAGCDLILAVGFDAVELIKAWQLTVPVVHIDSTPNTDQIYFADIEMIGHIPSILEDLRDSFRGTSKWCESEVRAHREALSEAYYSGRVAGNLNPTDVVDAVNENFRDAIVTTDVGSHKLLMGQGWKATRPNSFLTTNGLSSMGFALPAAITAKVLNRDRDVVCTIGDGGFAMVQGELRLAAALKLGIVVVVFCDNSLNRIELKQMARNYPSVLTRIEPTDLLLLAQSMDCYGARVENRGELNRVLTQARGGIDRPLVVEARVDPSQYLSQF
jgi:acetolactate synthase I/II/III large subunit